MAIANHFYHSQTKKYITIFGSIFNRMSIERKNENGDVIQRMPVPIQYAPFQKTLARIKQDKNLNKKTQITLPRMSFEITSMNYDSSRAVSVTQRIKVANQSTHTPAPYNISFVLNIMVEYYEDGAQIIEQILPFFKPHYSVTAEIMKGAEPIDLYFNIDSVTTDDIYEGSFEQKQVTMWTIGFTMVGGQFYGPISNQNVIKFVDVETDLGRVQTQPGLTEDGKPTKNKAEAIDWHLVNKEDDWAFITTIVERTEDD